MAWTKQEQRAYARRYAQVHRERLRMYYRRWALANRAHRRAYQRAYWPAYYRAHRAKYRAYGRKYWRIHRAEHQVISARHWARKWKRPGTFTVVEWKALLKIADGRCPLCHRRRKLVVHHIVNLREPVSCNWIWNVIPICRSCHGRLEPGDRRAFLYSPGCA